jgi:hypothetical protein
MKGGLHLFPGLVFVELLQMQGGSAMLPDLFRGIELLPEKGIGVQPMLQFSLFGPGSFLLQVLQNK